MGQADFLRLGVELGRFSPDESVPEMRGDRSVDSMTDVLFKRKERKKDRERGGGKRRKEGETTSH